MADRMKRAYSPIEVLKMKHKVLDFSGAWEDSIGKPAATGIWIVWGNSGNGKSSFVMQLAKYLCRFDKVIYDSLEESTSLSLKKSLQRHGMAEVSRRFVILDREDMEHLSERLRKKKSPGIVIVDSFQYSDLNYAGFKRLKEEHSNKLIIFISHAEGTRPAGRAAKKVEYDADVKIYVEGFQAMCKSRFMDAPGVPYVIWEAGAAKYAMGELLNAPSAKEKAEGKEGETTCHLPAAQNESTGERTGGNDGLTPRRTGKDGKKEGGVVDG